jgi:cell cycle checkpoint protein
MTSGVIHALPSPVERRGQKMYKSDWFDIMKKTRDAEDAVERVRAVLEKLSDEGRRWGKDVIVRELSCVLKAGGNEACKSLLLVFCH